MVDNAAYSTDKPPPYGLVVSGEVGTPSTFSGNYNTQYSSFVNTGAGLGTAPSAGTGYGAPIPQSQYSAPSAASPYPVQPPPHTINTAQLEMGTSISYNSLTTAEANAAIAERMRQRRRIAVICGILWVVIVIAGIVLRVVIWTE